MVLQKRQGSGQNADLLNGDPVPRAVPSPACSCKEPGERATLLGMQKPVPQLSGDISRQQQPENSDKEEKDERPAGLKAVPSGHKGDRSVDRPKSP